MSIISPEKNINENLIVDNPIYESSEDIITKNLSIFYPWVFKDYLRLPLLYSPLPCRLA